MTTIKALAMMILSLLLIACRSEAPLPQGIYSARSSHQLTPDYQLSVHSRVKFHDQRFNEIRSYRLTFADSNTLDLGLMVLGGDVTQHQQRLDVSFKQVKIELDADLYRRYVQGPRPDFALTDTPALIRDGQLQLQILQQDDDSLCLARIGGQPQCYLLSQVI